MPTIRENPLMDRWEQFLATAPFACPGCGYDMHGLRGDLASRCPECGRKIDVETAMYVGEPERAGVLLRTELSVWAVALLNLAIWVCVWALVPAMESSRWTSRPPTVWYGLLVMRMSWVVAFGISLAVWWLDLKIGGVHGGAGQRVFKIATRLALTMTLVHAMWAACRVIDLIR